MPPDPLKPESRSLPRAVLRWVELLLLFLGVPTLFWYWRIAPDHLVDLGARLGLDWAVLEHPGHLMLPSLALFTIGVLVALLCDRSFDRSRLWNPRALRPVLVTILVRFVVLAGLLTLVTWQLEDAMPLRAALARLGYGVDWPAVRLFSLPLGHPGLWAIIMVFYPAISVWPQEVLYRAFFFHRYARILPAPAARIALSALVFGFMHIVFMNPVAPLLCTLGGLLFAQTYHRTHSLFAASFEHALYGCWVFTVGLGAYFYGGTYGGTLG